MQNLELITNKIISGKLRWNNYVITSPTPDDRYMAQEFFFVEPSSLIEDLWDKKSQDAIKSIPNDIEQFKSQLYKNYKIDPKRADLIRKYLAKAKEELSRLNSLKFRAESYTEYGQSVINKNKFLVMCSVRKNGKRIIGSIEDYMSLDEMFVEEICSYYNSKRTTEEEIRLIARNEPWRSIWVCGKTEGRLFGKSAVNYSDEQKSLVVWSNIYDSVYSHPEKPEDIVINDDDCFDGWMILQRKGEKVGTDGITNEKIRNADQIMISSRSNGEIDKDKIAAIERMNSEKAKRIRDAILRE